MVSSSKNSGAAKSATPKKRLGFGYFIAAVIFLANPCINVIDILPDFFGYIFLIAGLSKWADLCPNVSDAVLGLKKLRWFMLIKLFVSLLVPIVDDTYVLVFTFGFAVIELMYALSAAWRIFDGFEYFGTRFSGNSVFLNIKTLRTVTNLFFVLKSLFCVLPELCSLSSFEYSGYVTSTPQIDFGAYKAPLTVFNIFIWSLIAVLWLVNILPYIIRISRDTPFLERVLHDYDLEITENVGLAFRRTLHSAVTLIIAGFVFFPNLWIDGVNVIPTFIGAIFLTAAMVKLAKMSPVSKGTITAQIIFALVSLISYAASLIFELYYGIAMIQHSFEAYDLYNITRALAIVEYGAMGVAVYMIYREIRRLIRMHLAPDPDVTDKRLCDIYETHRREADMGVIAGFVGFVIALIINIVYSVMRADIAPQYYIIPLLAMGIWFVYMINNLWHLYEQIEYKYI